LPAWIASTTPGSPSRPRPGRPSAGTLSLRLVPGFQPTGVYGMVAVGYDLELQVRDLRDIIGAEAARSGAGTGT
jgi:hypothetical protein